MGNNVILLRLVTIGGALTGAAAGTAVWGSHLAARGWQATGDLSTATAATAAQLLVGLAGLGLTLAAGWLALVVVVAGVDLARGRAVACTSGPWRPLRVRTRVLRLCAPTLGMALTCGVAAPATAGPGDSPGPDLLQRRGSTAARLTGLPLPVRPVSPASPRTGAVSARGLLHVVRVGDSLWTIAAHLLGPGAHDADVDRAWRAVYRRNVGRIGPDPDVLDPGTRLRLPAALAARQQAAHAPDH